MSFAFDKIWKQNIICLLILGWNVIYFHKEIYPNWFPNKVSDQSERVGIEPLPPERAAPSTGPCVNDSKYLFCDLVLDSEHHKGCP